MLELKIEQSRLALEPCHQDRGEVEEWQDSEGSVCAYGWVSAGTYRIRFPGLATFNFTPSANQVSAVPSLGADLDDVQETFYHSVLPLALQVMGWEALHASAVRSPAGVVVLCAVSGTGKSTLAYSLDRAGWPLWADDAVVVRANAVVPTATPLPFSLRLRPASQQFFGYSDRTFPRQSPADPIPSGDEPLAAVFVLERCSDPGQQEPVVIQRQAPAVAFPALLEHAYCFTLNVAGRTAAMVEHYLSLSERVPVFSVRFVPGFEHLRTTVDVLKAVVEERSTQR